MARESIRYMHPEFNQGDVEDGGWDEGPMYLQTALVHAVHFYAALERVMGTDDGFFELPGVRKAMDYFGDFTAPDGTWVNFSDIDARLTRDSSAANSTSSPRATTTRSTSARSTPT